MGIVFTAFPFTSVAVVAVAVVFIDDDDGDDFSINQFHSNNISNILE